jgi:hypothetical protein
MTLQAHNPSRGTLRALFAVRRWLRRVNEVFFLSVFPYIWLPLMMAAIVFDEIVFSHVLQVTDDGQTLGDRALWTSRVFLVYRILIVVIQIILVAFAVRLLLDGILARLALRPRATARGAAGHPCP